jgi:hypothetical protein
MDRVEQYKRALGLFHFNVQYVAGSVASYHRYCTEAIIPFLECFQRNAKFRASFELCGSGLEFFAKHYSADFDVLRDIVSRGQLELISSTYFPSLWIAFPLRDLVKSIEINRDRLSALGLRPSSIFFSQEAFFGQGLRALDGLFSAAICKDESLRYQLSPARCFDYFSFGRMRLVVGSGHLMNEMARVICAQPTSAIGKAGLGLYSARLKAARASLPEVAVAQPQPNWHWYHMGSGHHFTTPNSPENSQDFFSDARWTSMNEKLISDLQDRGYTFSTITEYVEETKNKPTEQLSDIIESSWNCQKSRGAFTWMNKQERAFDRNTNILGLAWRSRHELRKCEKIFESLSIAEQKAAHPLLDSLWTKQLLAESSDPCGWAPTPNEVRFGIESAESALISARALHLTLQGRSKRKGPPSLPEDEVIQIERPSSNADFASLPFLIGAEGALDVYDCGVESAVCALSAKAIDEEAGIGFRLMSRSVVFCPSGLESEPTHLEIDSALPNELFLPLANGLIGIGDNMYVIRLNRYGQPSAKVNKKSDNVVFGISGKIVGRSITWRFMLFSGTLQAAVCLANTVNDV